MSAKASIDEQKQVPHHLIDIIEANEDFSAGDFVKLAAQKIDEIFSLNKNVIIAGGSWFYIKSLLDKDKLPPIPINKELRENLKNIDNIKLWEKLNLLDPKRANLIHPNNKDKIIRSIEMCEFLKAPISSYKRQKNDELNSIWFRCDFPRDILYERINKRVDKMMDMGLYEEWKENNERYPNCSIMKNTIGYSEFYENDDIDSAIDKIKQHTRNFAKRQMTYFKSNDEINLIDDIDDILKVLKI